MNAPVTPVIIGVIDDGIAFAHERFRRNSTDSRVEYFWLQDGVAPAANATVPYGWEMSKGDIDTLLTQCAHAGVVDEDLVYARCGLVEFKRPGHKSAAWRAAHGTHVLDLAGGDPPPGYDFRLICVQLETRVTADTSGTKLVPAVNHAMEYILARAAQIGDGRLPVVINLSYGIIAGPHDGTSDLEQAIDDLIQQRRAMGLSLEVVLPAGNTFQSRTHAEISFALVNQSVSLPWRVHPDDQTPSFVEIWMPYRPVTYGPNRIKVTVTSPTGQSRTIRDTHGQRRTWWSANGPFARVSYAHWPNPTSRGFFLLALQPTAALDDTVPLAPAGTWTITLTNLSLKAAQRVHAWVQRDDSLYGHPRRGRQSYFDDPAYRRFDDAGREIETDDGNSIVKRAGTLNAIATGQNCMVIGGYHRRELYAARYSAAGPITPPRGQALVHRSGPDAAVPSEDSAAFSGILAAGSRSGSVVAMSGTSVAAPQLARWAATELAHARPADRATLAAAAPADEATHAAIPNPPPPERRGYGRVILDPVYPIRRNE